MKKTKFDDLKFEEKEYKKTIHVIDGIRFEPPKEFGDYLAIGLIGICLIILLPIWIIPYTAGKFFQAVSRKEETTKKVRQLICPVCKLPTIKGEYKRIRHEEPFP